MATPLGIEFSTVENLVLQCNDQSLSSVAETMIIQFDQKKFKQLLSGGSKSPLYMRTGRSALPEPSSYLLEASLY